jgi:hypothetical protein
MSHYALRLPDSLKEAARRLAAEDGCTMNQLFVTAIAEKSALWRPRPSYSVEPSGQTPPAPRPHGTRWATILCPKTTGPRVSPRRVRRNLDASSQCRSPIRAVPSGTPGLAQNPNSLLSTTPAWRRVRVAPRTDSPSRSDASPRPSASPAVRADRPVTSGARSRGAYSFQTSRSWSPRAVARRL